VKATPDVKKTGATGSVHAKKGAVDSGKKGVPAKGDARKGWKKQKNHSSQPIAVLRVMKYI
jgi:hypothetical protein